MLYEEDTLYDTTDDLTMRFDDPFAYAALDDELLDDGYYDEEDLIGDLDDSFEEFDEDGEYLYDDDYYEDFDGAY